MVFDRKKAKGQLQKQTESNYQNKDSGGFTSILSSDLPTWKCGDGKHKLDILPFVVGGGHPTLQKGDFAYMLEVWTHYRIGQNEDTYLCLNKMYKEDCPICEYRRQLDEEGETDKETLKALKPKQYTLYNVVVYDSLEETKKGVQIWNVSHFFMESKLLAIAEGKGGGVIPYADPDDGRTIYFQRKGAGAGNTSYIGHRFEERDTPISDKLLNSTFSLDECVIKPAYQDVYDALYGKHKTTEAPASTRGKASVEKEDDVSDLTGVDPDDIKAMSRKELIALITEHGLDIEADDYDEKSALAAAVISVITGGVGNKEDDDAPACPHKGGILGKSFDEYKECPNCPYMDECSEEYDKLKAATPIKMRAKK